MAKDINDPVASCSTNVQTKVPCHFPVEKLLPQENPQRPWLHISLDFLTYLPESEGNGVMWPWTDHGPILKVIPLLSLPTTLEITEIIFTHLFKYYGLPKDIVSNKGPQFTTHIWKGLITLCLNTNLCKTEDCNNEGLFMITVACISIHTLKFFHMLLWYNLQYLVQQSSQQ